MWGTTHEVAHFGGGHKLIALLYKGHKPLVPIPEVPGISRVGLLKPSCLKLGASGIWAGVLVRTLHAGVDIDFLGVFGLAKILVFRLFMGI